MKIKIQRLSYWIFTGEESGRCNCFYEGGAWEKRFIVWCTRNLSGILLPCLRFIMMFNSCARVAGGEELFVLHKEGAISLFPGFWKHLRWDLIRYIRSAAASHWFHWAQRRGVITESIQESWLGAALPDCIFLSGAEGIRLLRGSVIGLQVEEMAKGARL